jgi:hypothetical protein
MTRLILILSLFVAVNANAKSSAKKAPQRKPAQVACAAKPWNFGRLVPLRAISYKMSQLPQEELVHYAWGEILANRDDNVSLLILHYLRGQTTDPFRRGYFQSLVQAVYPGVKDEQKAVDEWPKRPTRNSHRPTLAEMCSIYNKITTLKAPNSN